MQLTSSWYATENGMQQNATEYVLIPLLIPMGDRDLLNIHSTLH